MNTPTPTQNTSKMDEEIRSRNVVIISSSWIILVLAVLLFCLCGEGVAGYNILLSSRRSFLEQASSLTLAGGGGGGGGGQKSSPSSSHNGGDLSESLLSLPSFLEGEWYLSQTLTDIQQTSQNQAPKRIGQTVSLKARYLPCISTTITKPATTRNVQLTNIQNKNSVPPLSPAISKTRPSSRQDIDFNQNQRTGAHFLWHNHIRRPVDQTTTVIGFLNPNQSHAIYATVEKYTDTEWSGVEIDRIDPSEFKSPFDSGVRQYKWELKMTKTKQNDDDDDEVNGNLIVTTSINSKKRDVEIYSLNFQRVTAGQPVSYYDGTGI